MNDILCGGGPMGLMDKLRDFLNGPSRAPDTAGPALADTPARSGGDPPRDRPVGEQHHTDGGEHARVDESGDRRAQ